MEKLGRL